MKKLPLESAPGLLSSVHAGEDAGVYLLRDDLALVQTVDFFPPVVDDPYAFGQIAAANALSDVYAVGARPITAMNIVAFPCGLGLDVLERILLGGHSKVQEAGAVLVGGHTIEDEEPKYGLAVTGVVEPSKMRSLGGARPGDVLVLTKPLGTGILATALKGGMLSEDDMAGAIDSMRALNRGASELFSRFGVRGCTDVTGFGLAGHLRDMLIASGTSAEVWIEELPLLDGAESMASMGMLPAGLYRNMDHCSGCVESPGGTEPEGAEFLYDPQTSGGLLASVRPDDAEAVLEELKAGPAPGADAIGRVIDGKPGRIIISEGRR